MIKKYFFRGKVALGHEGKVSFFTLAFGGGGPGLAGQLLHV